MYALHSFIQRKENQSQGTFSFKNSGMGKKRHKLSIFLFIYI